MKNSIMKNLIQYKLKTTSETQQAPLTASLVAGGNFIIGIEAFTSTFFTTFRIVQDGKQIFPLRSVYQAAGVTAPVDNWFNVPTGYFDAAAADVLWIGTRITDLCIPIKPDVPLKVEIASNGAASENLINIVVANEDDTTLLLGMLDKLFIGINKLGGQK